MKSVYLLSLIFIFLLVIFTVSQYIRYAQFSSLSFTEDLIFPGSKCFQNKIVKVSITFPRSILIHSTL